MSCRTLLKNLNNLTLPSLNISGNLIYLYTNSDEFLRLNNFHQYEIWHGHNIFITVYSLRKVVITLELKLKIVRLRSKAN